jgi:hypothetical protein
VSGGRDLPSGTTGKLYVDLRDPHNESVMYDSTNITTTVGNNNEAPFSYKLVAGDLEGDYSTTSTSPSRTVLKPMNESAQNYTLTVGYQMPQTSLSEVQFVFAYDHGGDDGGVQAATTTTPPTTPPSVASQFADRDNGTTTTTDDTTTPTTPPLPSLPRLPLSDPTPPPTTSTNGDDDDNDNNNNDDDNDEREDDDEEEDDIAFRGRGGGGGETEEEVDNEDFLLLDTIDALQREVEERSDANDDDD